MIYVKPRIEIKTYREADQWVALVTWIDPDGASDGQEAVGKTPTEALKAIIVELAEENAEYLSVIANLTGLE